MNPADSRGGKGRVALGIFFRGVAMGSADIIPGVSGGTVALITGIYDRLLNAIAAIDLEALTLLASRQWPAFWSRVDGAFLLTLLAGIATAVVVLANIIHWVMAHYPLPLWSFFFGLVLASALYLGRTELPAPRLGEGLAALFGMVLAAAIALSPELSFIEGLPGFFLAGFLAICAMILPGISGSFILLLLGMYGPVIAALTSLQLLPIALFVAGCALGLLSFSRFLQWILARLRRMTMALLAGFLLGSLVTLWPWQKAVAVLVDRHGEQRIVQSLPVSPFGYASQHGDSQWLLCLLAASCGLLLIGMAHWSEQRTIASSLAARDVGDT